MKISVVEKNQAGKGAGKCWSHLWCVCACSVSNQVLRGGPIEEVASEQTPGGGDGWVNQGDMEGEHSGRGKSK